MASQAQALGDYWLRNSSRAVKSKPPLTRWSIELDVLTTMQTNVMPLREKGSIPSVA
jgi:hypothetical protein